MRKTSGFRNGRSVKVREIIDDQFMRSPHAYRRMMREMLTGRRAQEVLDILRGPGNTLPPMLPLVAKLTAKGSISELDNGE